MKFLVAVGLLALVAVASATEGWVSCGGVGGEVSEFDIVGCPEAPCQIAAGSEITVQASLPSAESEATALETVVEAIIEGDDGSSVILDITTVVGVEQDACQLIEPGCPVEIGGSYEVETTIVSDDLFAGLLITAQIRLVDQDGDDFVCIQVDIDFTDA